MSQSALIFSLFPWFVPNEKSHNIFSSSFWAKTHILALWPLGVLRTFTELPAETMRTLKCRWTLLMPEPGYWMGMVRLIFLFHTWCWSKVTRCKSNLTYFSILCQVFRNARIIRKEGAEPEYLEDELNDLAVSGLLKRTYNTYKIFNGTFEGAWQSVQDLPKFREIIAEGFGRLIPSISADEAELFGTLDGIHFLSVNKNVFLQIQSFVNSVESSFDQIKNTVFMYRDHMVWSGLEQEDMRALYKYIVRWYFKLFGTSWCRNLTCSHWFRTINEGLESSHRSKWVSWWVLMMQLCPQRSKSTPGFATIKCPRPCSYSSSQK